MPESRIYSLRYHPLPPIANETATDSAHEPETHVTRKNIIITITVCFISVIFIQLTGPLSEAQLFRRNQPDIDLFINHWQNSQPSKEFGALDVWDILTKSDGDPLRPKRKGAVLTDLNAVRFAAIRPGLKTTNATLDSRQYVCYITAGEGTISSKTGPIKIEEGNAIIIPPGVEFSLENVSDGNLTMYIVEEPVPRDFIPKQHVVVTSEYDNRVSTNIRRVDSDDWLLSLFDGLSTLVSFNPVIYEPKSYVPPHVHEPDVEEVWIAVRGDMKIQVGGQQRDFPAGSAYKVPADGITPHTNINRSGPSKKLLWMMKVPVDRSKLLNDPRRFDNVI